MRASFVAFALVASMLGAGTSVKHPWMPVVGNRATTVLIFGLVLGGSLWLGLRHRHGTNRALLGVNVALAVAALPLGLYLSSNSSYYGATQIYSRRSPRPRA